MLVKSGKREQEAQLKETACSTQIHALKKLPTYDHYCLEN
jgi:hypothetical protein